jgi:hypothetical protein
MHAPDPTVPFVGFNRFDDLAPGVAFGAVLERFVPLRPCNLVLTWLRTLLKVSQQMLKSGPDGSRAVEWGSGGRTYHNGCENTASKSDSF